MRAQPLIDNLPDDPATLKSIVAAVTRQRDEARHTLAEAQRKLDDTHHKLTDAHHKLEDARCKLDDVQRDARHLEGKAQQLEVQKLRLEVELLRLKKWYYGPRADTLATTGDVAQMLLDFATTLEARPLDPQELSMGNDAAGAEAQTVRRVRRGRRNLAAFNNLPVTRHEHDLGEDQKPCPCCGKARQRIGEESSWQIEYIPGHFQRLEHVRIKYACRHCEHNAQDPQITLADKPPQPIDKGIAGPGLLAYVVTSKFSDYLPLYRLENIFARNGFEVSRATQSVWCGDVADLVKPLYDLMVRRVLASHVVATDDTVMPLLAPGKAKQARMWVYLGDADHPYNCFDFTPSRSRDGPAKFLKEYRQTLLADAYGGYDGIVVGNDITRAGCWAHARRRFVDAQKTHPAIAAEAVTLIGQLYGVEAQAKGLDAPARLVLRQSNALPVIGALEDKLHRWKDQLLPKHPMAEAVNYVLNQWNELSVYTTDGAVSIDNNASEREMKRIVLNRKNSLFAGNERGGRTAAILSSLTSTCRRHDVDPQRYLTQLLTNLPAMPISQLDQWLPDVWKTNQPPTPDL